MISRWSFTGDSGLEPFIVLIFYFHPGINIESRFRLHSSSCKLFFKLPLSLSDSEILLHVGKVAHHNLFFGDKVVRGFFDFLMFGPDGRLLEREVLDVVRA